MIFSFFFFKNVDAGAAKELMANLVKLQSSLAEVNGYAFCVYSASWKWTSYLGYVRLAFVDVAVAVIGIDLDSWFKC